VSASRGKNEISRQVSVSPGGIDRGGYGGAVVASVKVCVGGSLLALFPVAGFGISEVDMDLDLDVDVYMDGSFGGGVDSLASIVGNNPFPQPLFTRT
jgi:hypothetical protein